MSNNLNPTSLIIITTEYCWFELYQHERIMGEWSEAIKLTHWGRVTHICVGKLTIIGSDNGLSPERRQAIIWTNTGILLIGPLGTNFNEISIGIQTFSFKKMHLKMSSAKWRPFCLGLNELMGSPCYVGLSARQLAHNGRTWILLRTPIYFSLLFPLIDGHHFLLNT